MKLKIKAWLRAWTRPSALAMAVMMVLTLLPVPQPVAVTISPVVVAEAAPVATPQLQWASNIVMAGTAGVIIGQSVQIKETPVDNSFSSQLEFVSDEYSTTIRGSTNGVTTSRPNQTPVVNNSVTISTPNSDGVRTITFQDNFGLTTGGLYADSNIKTKDASTVYSVRAIYQHITTEGDVREVTGFATTGNGMDFNPEKDKKKSKADNIHDQLVDKINSDTTISSVTGTATAERALEVMSETRILIRCTTSEDDLNFPTFSVVENSGTGLFENINSVQTLQASTKAKGFTTRPTKNLVIRLSGSGSAVSHDITIHPTQIYEDDMSDKPEGATQTYNNYIKRNTYFEITYSPIYSNGIFLQVVTPQYVMNRIEEEISGSTAEKNYFKLAAGESLSYIENNFEILHMLRQYINPDDNFNFKIDWTWVPQDVMDDDGVFQPIKTYDSGHMSDYEDLIKPPNIIRSPNTEWGSAQLSDITPPRLENDVRGYLIDTVYYLGGGSISQQVTVHAPLNNNGDVDYSNADMTKLQVPIKEIIIKGTGKRPAVYVVGKSYGVLEENGKGTDNTKDIEYTQAQWEKLDLDAGTITMDAYRGGITYDSYPISPLDFNGPDARSPYPYAYKFRLDMGEKNGATPYVRVNLTGGVDLFTYEVNGAEVTPTYTNGVYQITIENTKYMPGGMTLEKGEATLTIIAKRSEDGQSVRAPLYVNMSFFKRNVLGEDVVNREADYKLTISSRDNTPARDNRLKNLVITDQDGKVIGAEYGFDFNMETRHYEIHIPFSSYEITLTPFQNDNKAIDARTRPIRMIMTDGVTLLPRELTYVDAKYKNNNPQDKERNGYYYQIFNSGSGVLGDSTAMNFPIRFYESNENSETDAMVGRPYTITIVPPTHDPRDIYWEPPYILDIIRDLPSEDNTLSLLGIYLESDEETNLITNFDPDQQEYDITIPYSTNMLKITTTKNDAAAEDPIFKVMLFNPSTGDEYDEYESRYELEGKNNSMPRPMVWLRNLKKIFKDDEAVSQLTGAISLKVTIQSEMGRIRETRDSGPGTDKGLRTYIVHVTRLPANDDPRLGGLVVTDAKENTLPFRDNQSFSPNNDIYTVEIPFSVKEIRFNITPNDPNVFRVELWQAKEIPKNSSPDNEDMEIVPDVFVDGRLAYYENGNDFSSLKLSVVSKTFPVADITTDYVKTRDGYHPFIIKVWAENETDVTEYLVRVIREEPSEDAALTDIILKDGLNQEIRSFVFYTDMFGCEDGDDDREPGDDTYYVSVPYSTRQVTFTPTTRHQYATIEIQEEAAVGGMSLTRLLANFIPYPIESTSTSKPFNLSEKWGRENAKEFHVVVTAESGKTTRTYCFKIYREPPSDDARLKGLVAQNTHDFKPLFIASKTDYTAILNDGAPGTIIIATANHPNATIKVNGVAVQSGQPSDLIELIEITTTIYVEVIAEDGTTRMVYKITITNPNLIEKTSNADLKDLYVDYGLMTPQFQSAVTEYEVTTKENRWSVNIIPKLADPLATMRVFSGTKVLGDYNGNYAMAIVDGKNDVSIEVTSPDGTVTKTYDVAIFRNDEEKLKNWTPLEAEDINFEQVSNPIIVKIEEYPRVGASVFNTIREEYPDYSIIFQGNDYSIRFDGKNLTRVIPQTEIYDFQMTYNSPDEDAIYDLIAEYEYNDDIVNDIVLPYFDYHGSLPGPATFSLSLGRHYANDLLYWHYYNMERERIDYYGTLQSNSQGTIAVSIDHFSTYVVSPEHRIAGSEDKDGVVDELGMVSNGQDLLGSGGKLNPNTGAEEGP